MIARIELSEVEKAELVELVTVAVLKRVGGSSEPSPYLSIDEAAEYLRAKRQRVYDLVSAGRLTRFKDGSRVLVSRAELDAYLSGVAHRLPTARQTRTARGRSA